MSQQEQTSSFDDEQVVHDERWMLILHNDDVNTFDHVIESLVDVCNHDVAQAEQCAIITHYKGKCDVKYGELLLLESMMNSLIRRGLSVTISQS